MRLAHGIPASRGSHCRTLHRTHAASNRPSNQPNPREVKDASSRPAETFSVSFPSSHGRDNAGPSLPTLGLVRQYLAASGRSRGGKVSSKSVSEQTGTVQGDSWFNPNALLPYVLGVIALSAAFVVYRLPFVNGLAARSGFSAAFSLIFVSELGDKTFFMSALLAAQKSRLLVFVGSVAALGAMSIISVMIGCIFQKLPAFLNSSLPIQEYLSAVMLVVFGFQSLKAALAYDKDECGEEASCELEDAKEAVKGKDIARDASVWGTLLSTFALIFAAEWGDRSMFATIALAAAQSPVGLALGSIAAHAVATVIAVVGGAMIARFLSEKLIGIVGGLLYLAFAVATCVGTL